MRRGQAQRSLEERARGHLRRGQAQRSGVKGHLRRGQGQRSFEERARGQRSCLPCFFLSSFLEASAVELEEGASDLPLLESCFLETSLLSFSDGLSDDFFSSFLVDVWVLWRQHTGTFYLTI